MLPVTHARFIGDKKKKTGQLSSPAGCIGSCGIPPPLPLFYALFSCRYIPVICCARRIVRAVLPFDPPPNWSSAVHSSKQGRTSVPGCFAGPRPHIDEQGLWTCPSPFLRNVLVARRCSRSYIVWASARVVNALASLSSSSSSSSSSSLHDRVVSKTHRSTRNFPGGGRGDSRRDGKKKRTESRQVCA